MTKKKDVYPLEFRVYETRNGEKHCYLNIDLTYLIDRYDYHDAPDSVTIYGDKPMLLYIKDIVDAALKDIGE